jgi:hypothetical protein
MDCDWDFELYMNCVRITWFFAEQDFLRTSTQMMKLPDLML